MVTKAQRTKEPPPAKKKETNSKKASAAAAKPAKSGTVAKAKKTAGAQPVKTKAAAKATANSKAKSPAKPLPGSAKSKVQSSVKSTKKTSAVKTTATKTKTSAGAADKVAKATRTGKTVAARRAEEARSTDQKQEEAATSGSEQTPVISETAKKVATSLIRRKAAKKKETSKAKGSRPIAFTLDEAIEIAKTQGDSEKAEKKTNGTEPKAKPKAPAAKKKEIPVEEVKQENRVLGAASIADILGYNPAVGPQQSEADQIPQKFLRYYKLLVELRDHVKSGLDMRTKETLKRSAKEDSGNLSAYSQHMADAGTDTFDRDFALSLVSSEQDALYEIEDAIRRIKQGTYGVCEITGKPINKERLLAVPFAKYSVEGQAEYERTNRKSAYRGGAFLDTSDEDVRFIDEDADE